MKQKISISIEGDLVDLLDEILKQGKFRNKSHIVEFSLNKLIQEEALKTPK